MTMTPPRPAELPEPILLAEAMVTMCDGTLDGDTDQYATFIPLPESEVSQRLIDVCELARELWNTRAQAPKAGAVATVCFRGERYAHGLMQTVELQYPSEDSESLPIGTKLYTTPPTQPEVRALVEAASAYAGPANDPNIGWRGASASSLDHFRCEACGQEHLDCTAIPHKPDCKATALLAALSALEKAE